jgi:serine/threonine protein kinase
MTIVAMNLPPPPADDDLVDVLERLKVGLVSHATGGSMPDDEYKKLRSIVLSHSTLADRVPRFLKSCRSTSDFWNFIKAEYGSYAERRTFLAEQLNPLMDNLESAEAVVGQAYERIDIVGEGGFGQVIKYHHKLLDMDFAFKVFAPAFSVGGEGHLERFFREARILFKLNHQSIVKVYDIGMLGRRPFIRMEFFDGQPLLNILKTHGRIPPNRALWLIRGIADALRHAHEEVQVVHRDIKPSNILVRKGDLRVIDFGLGVFIERDLVSRITKTGHGVVGGHYTAPELSTDPKLLDPRSDIYSLGAVWYEMLLGRPPGAMGSAEKMIASGVPVAHAAILADCLADFDHRTSTMSVLLGRIDGLPPSTDSN